MNNDFQGLSVVAICFAIFGFFWIQFKNWWSGKKVEALEEADKELAIDQAKVETRQQQTAKELADVPAIEKAKSDKQAVDEWNSDDK